MFSEDKELSYRKIKIANAVVVGGMIALGKTTLAQSIVKVFPNASFCPELDDDDELWPILLKKMYERSDDNLYSSLFQLYFVIKRFYAYKAHINQNRLTVFDRSIFEDWLFAKENLNNPFLFNYYKGTYMGICNQTIYEVGVPKLYVILSGDLELFKQRLFKRNRKVEIENYEKNKVYFARLLEQYESFMVNTCKNFGIEYLIVDAKLPGEVKTKMVLDKLKEIDSRK